MPVLLEHARKRLAELHLYFPGDGAFTQMLLKNRKGLNSPQLKILINPIQPHAIIHHASLKTSHITSPEYDQRHVAVIFGAISMNRVVSTDDYARIR